MCAVGAESDGILLERLLLTRGTLSSLVLQDSDFPVPTFILRILCLEKMEQTYSPVLLFQRWPEVQDYRMSLSFTQIKVRTVVCTNSPPLSLVSKAT